MVLRWTLYLAILLAPALGARTIDVSSETSALMRTGDTLVFHLFTWNYTANAAKHGLPENPTDVSFAFVSAPFGEPAGFTATLESADRTVSVGFGNPVFNPGTFQGSGYSGGVSALQGYLHLSSSLSEAIFGGSSAVIALRNTGPDVTVGLASYFLRQDIYASLSSGPLSVGAMPGWVELESPEISKTLGSSRGPIRAGDSSPVPEPGSGMLFLGGGALLCGFSVLLARLSGGRAGKARDNEKSSICIR